VNAIIATINIWWSAKQRKTSQPALLTASPVESPRKKRPPRLLSPMERRFIRAFRYMQVGLILEVFTSIGFPLTFTPIPPQSALDVVFWVLSFLSATTAVWNLFSIEKHMVKRIKNCDASFWKEIEDGVRRLREKNK